VKRRNRALLDLVRPPNIATALADVLAGYAIAGQPAHRVLPLLLLSTGCLYAGGVVLNDFFDRHLDAVERPERPIPSGRISAATAAAWGAALLALGIIAAASVGAIPALVAAAIAASALSYDAWAKHRPVAGPLNMGLCRGLNLLLGVAAAPSALVVHWPLATVVVLYIAGVTTLSQGEVHGGRRAQALVATTLVGVAAILSVLPAFAASQGRVAASAFAALLVWRTGPAFLRAWRTGLANDVRLAVRAGVLSLVLLDAALAAAYAGMIYAVGIVVVSLAAGRLARAFAVT
jgi:4-hydroxybenzoate polyprenyltransferase